MNYDVRNSIDLLLLLLLLLYCIPIPSEICKYLWILNSFSELFFHHHVKVKRKAVPLQARSGPEGSRELRFPDFVTTAEYGGRLSALRTGRLYPQEMLLVLIYVRGWVDPRAIVRSEEFYVNENPMTPAGFEPATFRFVAQHLSHCATAVPHHHVDYVFSQSLKMLGLTVL